MPTPKAVTRSEFDGLTTTVSRILDLLERQTAVNAPALIQSTAAPVADPIQEKKIAEASPNKYQTDDEWDAIARDIIGDAIDHTEVERKGGGVKFTVVIKTEKSNAPKEYIDRMKVDRRTREVGAEGTEGVTQYCKLIRANLARPNK